MKTTILKDWINPIYLEDKKLEKIKINFYKSQPYNYLSLDNFLLEGRAEILLKTLKDEDYYIEDSDLYQFLRTVDFKDMKHPILREFREFLKSDETIQFFEKMLGSKISKKIVDSHSLKLLNTHYLLCHDDLVLGRQFAFIFNLSKDFNEKDGGQFEIFDTNKDGSASGKIIKSIIPKFNRFNLFKVSKNSYHQIREVCSDKERISIGGWFHY